MTEINMDKARKPSSERRGLCWALRPAARDWQSREERKHARWAEGAANALEERDSVCVL